MYQPEVYGIALMFMILSMLCWGSWANSMKLCPGYRFQLFYWDYVIGLVAGAVLWGSTLGSMGTVGRSFYADIAHSGVHPILLAMAGGAIFNVANLLSSRRDRYSGTGSCVSHRHRPGTCCWRDEQLHHLAQRKSYFYCSVALRS